MAKKLKFGSPAWRRKYNLAGAKKKSTRGKMAKKSKKSYSKSGMPRWSRVLLGAVVPVAYGAFRKPIADVLPNIPKVENYSDEIILGGSALAVSLFTGNKYANMIARPIADVELARVGEKVKLGLPMGNSAITGNVSQVQSMTGYL
jgi:aspartate ammonia-lyase